MLLGYIIFGLLVSLMFGCVSLGNITEEENCGPNPGGETELYIARKSDVLSIPAPGVDGVTVSTAIIMKDGKGFAKWDTLIDNSELSHKTVGEVGSQSVEQALEVYIPRARATIDSEIQKAINGGFIVISVDGQGQKRIGGDLLRPMTMVHDYKGGKKNTDKKGTTLQYTSGCGHVPYYYTATIPVLA
jgi:hypothetical protein